MKRFHLTEEGQVGPCEASVRNCPVGGQNVHFPTEDAARQAFELSMAGETFSQLKKPRGPFSGDMEGHLSSAKDELVGAYALFPGDTAEGFQEQVIVMAYARVDGDKLVLVSPRMAAPAWDDSLKSHLTRSALTSLALKTCDEAGLRYEGLNIEGFKENGDNMELTVSTRGPAEGGPGVPVVPVTAEKIAKIEGLLSDKLNVANQSLQTYNKQMSAPIFDEFDGEVAYIARERSWYLSSLSRTYNDLKDIAKDDRDPRLLRDKAIALLPKQPAAPETSDQYQSWQAKYQAISEFLGELSPEDEKSSQFIAAQPKEVSWYYKD